MKQRKQDKNRTECKCSTGMHRMQFLVLIKSFWARTAAQIYKAEDLKKEDLGEMAKM